MITDKFRLKNFDPRVQIVVGILSIISVFVIQQIHSFEMLYIVVILVFLWILVRDKLFLIFKQVLRIYPMLLLITFLLPFQAFGSTKIIGQVGSFIVYSKGLEQFFLVHLKSFCLLNISFALTQSVSYKQAIAVLDRWQVPHWMISIYTYLHRVIQVFSIEVGRLRLALQARNMQLKGFRSLPLLSNFLLVYLFRVSERSDRSYQAMISRGFSGHFPVTVQLSWKLADTLFLLSALILIGVFWIW